MRRWIACLAVVLLCMQPAMADEGMWLMHRLAEIYPQMKARGLKIKDKEIYNEKSAALADAVVAVDGGMGTGSMISDQGLMITNHHVAYSDICALSTPECNLLETGFWARTRDEEIPVPGKTVWFVRKVVDVTDEANALKEEMKAAGKWGMMAPRRLYAELEGRYGRETECEVSCYSMWGGKMYLMFYYDIYKDVRLVGTPPASIGAFGGDYDNWGWPQHKGDFALYRVYADREGRPAAYSADNVPLKPRRVLQVATGGVHDGDFAMVIGFPGRTNRYASSFAVAEKQCVRNPIVVANRHDRMDILKRHMERDPRVRMEYSDAYFGLSNYADYAKWENKCLRRFDVVAIRDNVPLKPRRVLQVATGGVHDGDFAMVIGFPGRTNRYASSFAVAEKQCVRNPIVVANRHDRMDILKRHMERDPRVRMEYSDAYFGLSNYADYAKWENKCLRRFDVVAIREAEEEHLQRWIEADSARKAEDGTLLEELARGYKARQGAERNLNYFREAWLGPSEALLVANRVSSYLGKLERLKQDSLIVDSKDARSVVAGSGRLSRNYDAATDRDLLARMVVNFTANVPREMWGAQLQAMYDKAGGNADRMARAAFDASFCSDPARYDAYFSKNRSVAEIRRDPMVALTESVTVQRFTGGVDKAEKRGRARVGRSESRYADVLYDFRASEGLAQYPNANSTMRLTYGSVQPLNPSDGVHYDSRSTIAGYMEKYNPDEYEYRVDDRMRRLIAKRDWGRWGENDTLYVNFLTDNDITGGNSGSPVLDGKGHLIGLAFDGNRESMAGDVWFHPELARTVCVDIRYVMWVIDKYADAGWLLDEMKFAK
ncbi:S46 family peptidase [Alistipes onderdonkii]|nr:S46 family peptidase [Alistipes onderdonkii]